MWIAVVAYILTVSVIAMLITAIDKAAAIKQKRRIRERTLFVWSLIGGSVSMYLTMLAIRHKTKHKRFMIGLPIMIVLQAVAIYYLNTLGILM